MNNTTTFPGICSSSVTTKCANTYKWPRKEELGSTINVMCSTNFFLPFFKCVVFLIKKKSVWVGWFMSNNDFWWSFDLWRRILLPLSDCFLELCPDLPILHLTQLLQLIDQTFEIVRIPATQTGYWTLIWFPMKHLIGAKD